MYINILSRSNLLNKLKNNTVLAKQASHILKNTIQVSNTMKLKAISKKFKKEKLNLIEMKHH